MKKRMAALVLFCFILLSVNTFAEVEVSVREVSDVDKFIAAIRGFLGFQAGEITMQEKGTDNYLFQSFQTWSPTCKVLTVAGEQVKVPANKLRLVVTRDGKHIHSKDLGVKIDATYCSWFSGAISVVIPKKELASGTYTVSGSMWFDPVFGASRELLPGVYLINPYCSVFDYLSPSYLQCIAVVSKAFMIGNIDTASRYIKFEGGVPVEVKKVCVGSIHPGTYYYSDRPDVFLECPSGQVCRGGTDGKCVVPATPTPAPTPIVKCEAGWVCKNNSTLAYQIGDCSYAREVVCDYLCSERAGEARCLQDATPTPVPTVPTPVPTQIGECADTVRMCGGGCPPCPVDCEAETGEWYCNGFVKTREIILADCSTKTEEESCDYTCVAGACQDRDDGGDCDTTGYPKLIQDWTLVSCKDGFPKFQKTLEYKNKREGECVVEEKYEYQLRENTEGLCKGDFKIDPWMIVAAGGGAVILVVALLPKKKRRK